MCKFISVWVGGVVLFSSVAFANIEQYAPEANNRCPHVTAFSTVLLNDANLNCGDTAGMQQLVRKLNGWIPARLQRPRIALSLKNQDNNAFFSGYGLHVPLWFGETTRDHRFNLFPNDVARAVIAHEYGHAMLNHLLAMTNATDREFAGIFWNYGRLTAMMDIYKAYPLAAIWLAEYTKRFGPQAGWTPAQKAEADQALAKMNDQWAQDGNALSEKMMQIERGAHPTLLRRWDQLAHYHEFFADVIAVLDSGDWTITRRVFQALGLSKKSVTPRDFTDAANQYEDVKPGSPRFEAHDSMGPSRYALYKKLAQEHCLKPNPQVLVPVLMQTIADRVRAPLGDGPGEVEYHRKGFNAEFTRMLFSRLDRVKSELCR